MLKNSETRLTLRMILELMYLTCSKVITKAELNSFYLFQGSDFSQLATQMAYLNPNFVCFPRRAEVKTLSASVRIINKKLVLITSLREF